MFRNTLKTFTLLATLGGFLVLIGSLVFGGVAGTAIGLALGLLVVGGSYWFSDRLAIRAARAVPVADGELTWLRHELETLAQRGAMPAPRLYVSDDLQPNAFASGRNERNAVVCVTRGLLQALDPDEVRGVLAHELAHIKHRDILIGSVAAAVATGISAIANLAMFAGAFGGGDDEDRPNPIVLLLVALVAPIAATIVQLALSRSREFEADRLGARLTGDPVPLARALAKIDSLARQRPMDVAPAQASAYIVNPLTGRKVRFAALFLTHPPTEERIARLMNDRVPAAVLR